MLVRSQPLSEAEKSLEALMGGSKFFILSYYQYPTVYESDNVVKQINRNKDRLTTAQDRLCELVDNTHLTALENIYGTAHKVENKAAVEIRVDGFNQSLYLVVNDPMTAITTQVRQVNEVPAIAILKNQ